jgi:hypothetical protein
MSVAAQKWAWEQNLPDRPKFVLVTMADQADSQTGHVRYQRTDTQFFVEKCNISERSFYRSIAALARNGYLRRESGRGKNQETQYWLSLDRAPTEIEAWSWGNEQRPDEADQESSLTQDVVESASVADQQNDFESAKLGSDELPSVAEQESFDSPKITRAARKKEKTDFSKVAQSLERGAAPSDPNTGWYDRTSREARAVRTLCQIVGREDHFDNVMSGARTVCYPHEITPQLLAMAEAPPRREWVVLTGQQLPAWFGFAKKSLPNLRIKLDSGARAPWSWPPRKDGTIGTGPPDALADEDVAELKKTG